MRECERVTPRPPFSAGGELIEEVDMAASNGKSGSLYMLESTEQKDPQSKEGAWTRVIQCICILRKVKKVPSKPICSGVLDIDVPLRPLR